MSETNESDEKTRGRTLGLRRTVESGHVRQSFSHGRSKSVLVEKKKRRAVPGSGGVEAPVEAVAKPAAKPQAAPAEPARRTAPSPEPQRRGAILRALSDEERDARTRALADARERDAVERVRAKEEAVVRAQQEEELRVRREAEGPEIEEPVEAVAPEAPRADAKGKLRTKADEAARAKTDDAPRKHPPAPKDADAPPRGAPGKKTDRSSEAATPRRKTEEQRVRGRLTITNALDEEQRQRSLASLKRRQERQKKHGGGAQQPQAKMQREVVVPEAITIQELSNRMAERGVDVIKFLMSLGEMHKITDMIDADQAQLVVEEFGHTIKRVSEADVEEGFIGEIDATETLMPRAPVVTIMGHVDHGKTSLLDAIRTTNVVSGEAGGITQHIGAYQVVGPNGQKITFIDTPGHEAFTAMRARGAKVTDIVVLVVAADDGVMPQTVEAINHARAAQAPLIVAINKIDKPGVDPNRVRTDLLHQEVVVESMSGDVQDVEVSALKKINLDKLLDAIMLQAEVLELKANPDRPAEGVVVEAKLERGRGPVGTALIQRGTLRVGDIVVAGQAWGKVRALINDVGEQVKSAGPSEPVEVLGFSYAPEAGDQFAVVESEARARELTDYRARERRQRVAGAGPRGSLEQMMSQLKAAGVAEFPLVIKGDVQGSVEAIVSALEKLGTDEVKARILHAGVGAIAESDISLASTSSASVIGFNVRANAQAKTHAERDGTEIRYYSVIYDLVDDVKQAMSGMLAPERRETFLGNAQVLQVFNVSKIGKVAGCRVTEGKVARGAQVRLIRDGVVIHEGKLSTLRRVKDDVREVVAGQECGMSFESYQDMREGDVIECFEGEQIQRAL